jgi:hypothetical protein
MKIGRMEAGGLRAPLASARGEKWMGEKLEAGRELNALIAEKIMGWKWYAYTHELARALFEDAPARQLLGLGYIIPATMNEPIAEGALEEVEPYSTDIAAAWEVVKHAIKTKGAHWEIASGSLGWQAAVVTPDHGTSMAIERGESAPLAICRAALKVAEESTVES